MMRLFLCILLAVCQSQEIGQIVYFEDDCPTDFEPYEALQGRTPIGADGSKYRLGATGGSETVSLSTSNIPPHYHHLVAERNQTTYDLTSHSYISQKASIGSSQIPNTNFQYYLQRTNNMPTLGKSSSVGSGSSFSIMPPYKVLNSCIRVKDSKQQHINEMQEMLKTNTKQINETLEKLQQKQLRIDGLEKNVQILKNESEQVPAWVSILALVLASIEIIVNNGLRIHRCFCKEENSGSAYVEGLTSTNINGNSN